MKHSAFTLLELLAALVILSAIAGTSAVLMRDARGTLQGIDIERSALDVYNRWDELGRPGIEDAEGHGFPVWSWRDEHDRQWHISIEVTRDALSEQTQGDESPLSVEAHWIVIQLDHADTAPIDVLRIPWLVEAPEPQP